MESHLSPGSPLTSNTMTCIQGCLEHKLLNQQQVLITNLCFFLEKMLAEKDGNHLTPFLECLWRFRAEL